MAFIDINPFRSDDQTNEAVKKPTDGSIIKIIIPLLGTEVGSILRIAPLRPDLRFATFEYIYDGTDATLQLEAQIYSRQPGLNTDTLLVENLTGATIIFTGAATVGLPFITNATPSLFSDRGLNLEGILQRRENIAPKKGLSNFGMLPVYYLAFKVIALPTADVTMAINITCIA